MTFADHCAPANTLLPQFSDMSLPFEAGLKIKLRARILALSLPIWAGSEV